MTGIRALFHSGTTGPARKIPVAKAARYVDFSLFLRGSELEGGSGVITDNAPTPNTLTLIGNPTQSTVSPFSQSGFGVEFDGSSGLRVSNASTTSPIWQTGAGTGTGPWAIDLFAIFEEDTNEYKPLVVNSNGSDGTGFALAIDSDGTLVFRVAAANAGWTRTLSTTWRPTPGAWHHIHVARSTTAFVIAADGTRLSNITIPTGEVYTAPTLNQLYIGENPFFPAGGSYFKGRMHGVRIRNSAGMGTAATYVLPAGLAANTSTTLLTAQTNRYVDVSAYGTKPTILVEGSPKIVIGNPFQPTFAYYADLTGGSAYFNGTADAINCPLNAALTSSTNLLLLDAWVYPENLKSQSTIYGDADSAGANGSFQFYLNETGNLCFRFFTAASTSVVITSTLRIVMGQWNHIGVSRSTAGNQLSFACNGVTQIIAAAFTGNFRTGTRPTLGRNGDVTSVDTYFSGLLGYPRYLKSAGYTSATYTVPTAGPVTTSTSLNPWFNTSKIFDRRLANPIVAMNGAALTTVRKLANTHSFDLTGSKYLTMPNSSMLTPGLKNFTIRLWAYKDSLGVGASFDRTSVLFEQYNTGSDYTQLKILSTGQLQLEVNGDILCVTAATDLVPIDTWANIFVSRLDTTLFVAINGIQVVNTSVAPAQRIGTRAAQRTVIGGVATGVSANAYIEDFVLSLGTAEYVSNHVPVQRTMTGQEWFRVDLTTPFALTSVQSIDEVSFSTTTAIPTILTNLGDVQIRNTATVTQVTDSNVDNITLSLSNTGSIPVGGTVSGTGVTTVNVGGASSRTWNCTFGNGRYTIPVTLTSNHRIAVKDFVPTGVIENYTIPATAEYLVQIVGACGGFNSGYKANGGGAEFWCKINLTGGTATKVLVGVQGMSSGWGAGGGGTFFTTSANSPILVAGGGAGSTGGGFSGANGTAVTKGTVTTGGGTNGGAGLTGNGQNAMSFTNGGLNTIAAGIGQGAAGFGGGGSTATGEGPGGGGGYSGGSAYNGGTSWWPATGVTILSSTAGTDGNPTSGGWNGYLRMARNI